LTGRDHTCTINNFFGEIPIIMMWIFKNEISIYFLLIDLEKKTSGGITFEQENQTEIKTLSA